jgi:hypothetical protein
MQNVSSDLYHLGIVDQCTQLGLEARSGGRFPSNVNGTTVCVSHVSGITGARHVIEGNIEYGYTWLICGWTSNSGLNLTVACWAIAVEAKMSIDPAARANCKDFGIVSLRTAGERWFGYRKKQQPARLKVRDEDRAATSW